jgi:hypothetical protein
MSQKVLAHSRAIDPTYILIFRGGFHPTILNYFSFLSTIIKSAKQDSLQLPQSTDVFLRLSVYQIETESFRFGDYSVIRSQWQKYVGGNVTAPTVRTVRAPSHIIDMNNLHLALASNSYL